MEGVALHKPKLKRLIEEHHSAILGDLNGVCVMSVLWMRGVGRGDVVGHGVRYAVVVCDIGL